MAVRSLFLTVALCLGSSVFARTNLQGCTYYDSVIKPSQQAAYATRLWYVPDSGEVCKLLDCGGGRAPPKTTVPGCPLYEGTETYSPSFIDPKTLGQAVSVPVATGGRSVGGTSTASGGSITTTAAAPATTSIASIASATSISSIASIASTTSVASVVSVVSSAVETSASASASAKSTQSGSTSGSGTGRDGSTSTSTGAAGSLATGAAALAPCLAAGVAAGLGFF